MKHRLISLLLVELLILSLCIPIFADYTEGCFLYTVDNDAVTITGYFGDEEAVWIPASIAGFPVSTIASGAFVDTPAKTVYLPDTVMTVAIGAVSSDVKLVYNANTGAVSGSAPGDGTAQPDDYEDSVEIMDAPTEGTDPTQPVHPIPPEHRPHSGKPATPAKPNSGSSSGAAASGGSGNVTAAATVKPTAAATESGGDLGGWEERDTEPGEEITPAGTVSTAAPETAAPEAAASEPVEKPQPSFPWLWIALCGICGLGLLSLRAWKRNRS